jgi:hypothetical protein
MSTGVPPGTVLTVHSGDVNVSVSGTVIDGWDITGHLYINSGVDNVTVKNSRVRCNGSGECFHSFSDGSMTVTRVDIGPNSLNTTNPGIAIMDGAGTSASPSRHIYGGVQIQNVGDGIRCDGGFTFTNSYVHNLGFGGGVHSDSCQATNNGNMLFKHNWMEGGNTSVFLIQSNPANITITMSWLGCIKDVNTGEQTSYITNVGPSVPQNGVIVSNNEMKIDKCQSGVDGSSSVYIWSTTNWFGNVLPDGTAISHP